MFITPVTVPLKAPPTSMGTAHAGPITSSRKKNDAARHRTDVHALSVIAAGIRNVAEQMKAGAATTRRANLALPDLRYIRSVKDPPTTSPIIPANSGREPM